MATIEERVKRAVQAHYNCNCEYPCSGYNDCVFGSGSNTAWDCEECGGDEFEAGYLKGATEQRKIDIEKVRWFLIDNCMGTTFTSCDLELLIKAMEE